MINALEGRNGSGEFARRSMNNLQFILEAAAQSADVHPVTQTVTALLAIIVFPWERNAFAEVRTKRLPIAAQRRMAALQDDGPAHPDEQCQNDW